MLIAILFDSIEHEGLPTPHTSTLHPNVAPFLAPFSCVPSLHPSLTLLPCTFPLYPLCYTILPLHHWCVQNNANKIDIAGKGG